MRGGSALVRAPGLTAFVTMMIVAGAMPPIVEAQRAPALFDVDAIGPRSSARVRAELRSHLGELDECRGEVDALVRVGLAIAPDGAVLQARAIDDPDLDVDATECVIAIARGWRFRGRASSVTTVSWSLHLAARSETPDAEPAPEPPTQRCWCFSWVHGGDHGRTCEPTRARCAAERRSSGRDATECRAAREPSCEHEAWIDGRHLRRAR